LTLTNLLEKHINKISFPFKDEEALSLILKAKLTKKEYKILFSWLDGNKKEHIVEKLKLDNKRYEEISHTVIKKLNAEKLKQLLYINTK